MTTLASAMAKTHGGPMKLISIVCPVYNEEGAVVLFYERLKRVLEPLSAQYVFELIFTNNRSTDGTLTALLRLREVDSRVQIVTLSRNFGYQASLQAGLSHAKGAAVIIIDVDCEDPPEMISDFLDRWEQGYDVVYGIRCDRPEAWPLKQARNGFYRVLRAMADMDIVLYMAEFALMSANVRDCVISNGNTFPFIRSEIGYAGFSRCGIKYRRKQRVAGVTHYNLFRMTTFAIGGILTSSTVLLRAAAYCWPILAIANAALLASGWAGGFSMAVVIDLLWIAFLVTVHGLYLARVYKNGMGRPVFIVDQKHTYLNRAAAAGE